MNYRVWENLAYKYNKLWVQKYSLGPTRKEVKKIIFPLLDKNPQIKIFEIGCGTGQLVSETAARYHNINYFGIDAANAMIAIAQKQNENLKFESIPIEEYETNEKFDLIICTHAFPYFPEKEKTLKKISGFCNKGAKIIVANASCNSVKDKIITFFLKATTSKASYLSLEEMKKLFGKASLNCINVKIIRERKYMPTIALFDLEKL